MSEMQPDNAKPPAATGPAEPMVRSRRGRWLVYGSNVGVFVIAVVAIVTMVNWLMVSSLAHHGGSVRYDLTATRRYSLSPQSRRLLAGLDRNVNIAVLYAAGSRNAATMQRVTDLLGEYSGRSARVKVRRIDPTTDPVEFEKLMGDLMSRFGDETARGRAALEESADALDTLAAFCTQQPLRIREAADRLAGLDETVNTAVATLLPQQLRQAGSLLEQNLEDLRAELAGPLPDYAALAADTRSVLEWFATDLLGRTVTRLGSFASDPTAPDGARDALLGMVREFEPLRDLARQTAEKLRDLNVDRYSQLRSKVSRSDAALIYLDPDAPAVEGTEGVAALDLEDISPRRVSESDEGQLTLDRSFEGEEKITGAIYRLTARHKTKLVIVNTYPASVLDGRIAPQFSFTALAERLRQMNIEVVEWNGGGGVGPGGRPQRPEPRPVAEPGQKLIYLILPPLPPNPQMPFNPAEQAGHAAVSDFLAEGGSALILVNPTPGAFPGSPDPYRGWLEPVGISVDRSHVVMLQYPDGEGGLRALPQYDISAYASDHALAGSVTGLLARALASSPINLPASPPTGVSVFPVVRSPQGAWAESAFTGRGAETPDEGERRGPIDIVAAATRTVGDTEQRLVVIADQFWATDHAAAMSIAHPANAELTANSVYWLAGLDELIAPGARTQEVRRIGEITRSTNTAVWWLLLAGMPAVCLAVGAAVWLTRRG